jgi:glycosyltransferase involved in cell wall biosynthesis
MRIVYITNNYTPYSGGVVSSINASVTALRKAGYEVFIITLNFLGDNHVDPDYVLRIPSVFRCMYKNNHLALPWRPYHHMLRMIKELQPDIIHVHHPFYLGKTGLHIAQKLSLPIVFTYHSIYEGYTHYVPLPQCLMRYITTKKVISFCRQLQGIIAPSMFIRDHIQSHCITTSTAVIPSGLQELFISAAFQLKKYDFTRPFKLVYVGRLTKEKNIPFILDVMQMLGLVRAERVEALNEAYPSTSSGRTAFNNFQLTLVGYGAEYDNLRSYAYNTLKLSSDVVQFVHKPPKQKLLEYYQEADLFLFPSFLDTQGLVLAEAMACGTPVLAVHGPGQQDIIKDGYNGFLVASKLAMAEKIIAIAQDQKLHTQLRQGAFETSKKYHPQSVTARLINFYQTVLESTNNHSAR